MQLLTAKVYDRNGECIVVNRCDLAMWALRGFTEGDPRGGTFTRERPRIDLDAKPETTPKPKGEK